MNAESAFSHRGAAGRPSQAHVGVRLAYVAAAVGAVILAAAAFVPVVTVQAPPVTSVAPSSGTPTPSPTGTATLTAQPRVTLVAHDGVAVLGLAAIPLVVALGVGLLLWYTVRRASRPAALAAWTLAIALTAVAVVGFVTILIGIVVIPVGVLLIIACARVAPALPRAPGQHT